MKRIAIVGVERSGKTVLMTVLGETYRSPDKNGIFLAPKNRETFAYYTQNADLLRKESWPLATMREVSQRLEWSVKRKNSKGNVEEIGDLVFLDFGGEIYRFAFGEGSVDVLDEKTQEQVLRLRGHVTSADILVMLVNLSDIINGNDSSTLTIETKCLSLAILKYIQKSDKTRKIILAFSKADSYDEEIKRCGGLRKTLAKYMQEVDAIYGDKLTLCAISAVDKTKPAPDNSGLAIPDKNFSSQGLDTLMQEIVTFLATSKPPTPKPKRGCLRWIWLLVRTAACIVAFIGGICMREQSYQLNYYDNPEMVIGRVVWALEHNAYNIFKKCIESLPVDALSPDSREFAGLFAHAYDRFFYKERDSFWNNCKFIEWIAKDEPEFIFYSGGKKIYVFEAHCGSSKLALATYDTLSALQNIICHYVVADWNYKVN